MAATLPCECPESSTVQKCELEAIASGGVFFTSYKILENVVLDGPFKEKILICCLEENSVFH